MDYSKIDNNKAIEAIQKNINNCIQEPEPNLNLIQNNSSNQINKQDNSEPERDYNEHNSCAKNESHLHHPHRSFSMPLKKQHSEPKDHKQQITPLSSKYLDIVRLNTQPNENAPLKKLRDEMQKECSTSTAVSGNMLDDKIKVVSTSNLNDISVEELMQNKPVNEEKYHIVSFHNDNSM